MEQLIIVSRAIKQKSSVKAMLGEDSDTIRYVETPRMAIWEAFDCMASMAFKGTGEKKE